MHDFQQFDERLSWKSFYEAALCERDPYMLRQRITDAQKAIAECTLALLMAHIDNKREKQNLASAYLALEDLKKSYPLEKDAAYLECPYCHELVKHPWPEQTIPFANLKCDYCETEFLIVLDQPMPSIRRQK
jgi:hypothetical protein